MARGDPKNAVSNPVKAALFMVLLGEELAAPLFSGLSIEEVKRLNKGMAQISDLTQEAQDAIVQETVELLADHDPARLIDADRYLESLVRGTMEPEAAKRTLEQLHGEPTMRLRALEPIDGKTLANLIRKEHPQTIALIMAYTGAAKAAAALGQLPVDTQVEVCLRMASLDSVAPRTLRDVESALMSEMKGMAIADAAETSGVELVAEVLNNIEKTQEERIFEQLSDIDPELADEIRQNMFVFEDLVHLDDRGMQSLLKEVDQQKLQLALKTATEEVKAKVLNNLSKRAADMLLDDMEAMGPTRLSDVEAVQNDITRLALRLESEGKLVIATGGGDDEFV